MPELTGTKDMTSYLRSFWRWKWLFLFFLIAAPLAAFVMNNSQTALYKSSALVGINGTTVNSSLVQGSSGSFSTSNITAIAELVTTTPVADIAAGLLNPPANPGQVAGEVTATGDPTTSFLTISAQDRSPARAAAIANAFARAISLNLEQSAIGQINSSIKTIRTQLRHLGPNAATDRIQLQQQLNQLIVARSTQGSGAAILQAATPSGTPVGGGTRQAVELGLVIGLLLGFGAVVLAENADRRVRTPEDLERMTDLPLLAVIGPGAFTPGTATNEDDEAFQMLRTSLMYFNVDRDLDSIVITSSATKEGKTTVATRLAFAAATSGRDVILVDADLRRAQVGARLGIHSRDGLGSVIAGSSELDDVLVDQPLGDTPGAGRLQILPAGPPPPNPAALMSSPRTQQIIRQLESQSDLVIIDTPAALAVSDPLPLMRAVTGVVVVARMNSSTRQTIRRLQKIVESAHGDFLGVVATGARGGLGYSHYYPKYYAQNGSNGHTGLARLRPRWTEHTKTTTASSDE